MIPDNKRPFPMLSIPWILQKFLTYFPLNHKNTDLIYKYKAVTWSSVYFLSCLVNQSVDWDPQMMLCVYEMYTATNLSPHLSHDHPAERKQTQ